MQIKFDCKNPPPTPMLTPKSKYFNIDFNKFKPSSSLSETERFIQLCNDLDKYKIDYLKYKSEIPKIESLINENKDSQDSDIRDLVNNLQANLNQYQYLSVYQDPYVINLKQSLNKYLTIGNGINDLVSYDSSYYKSKFVVLTINNNIGGGKDIQIIFQDKPDMVFSAWVYKLATGEYELRSFNSKDYNKQTLNKIISSYNSLIFDKNHSI